MTAPASPSALPDDARDDLHARIVSWYAANARDLPWRSADATPWGVLVSEVMLQQTPVARVLPAWEAWMRAWPRPGDLAAVAPGEAVRAWGRLGYPRRALRLHQAAVTLTERHDGEVPADVGALRALPGVGDYTAHAVATFAFGQRHVVLDTNVRRVLGRAVGGSAQPPAHLTVAERRRAEDLLPDAALAPTWAVGVMELGALVCTAAAPRCGACPVADLCRWRAAGHPASTGPTRPPQTYAGTDRQCRGRLLGVLRDASGSVTTAQLAAVWEPAEQRNRCLASLLEDGLVVGEGDGRYALP